MVHSLEENSSEENGSLSVLVGLRVVLVPETNRVDEGLRRYEGSAIRLRTEQISLHERHDDWLVHDVPLSRAQVLETDVVDLQVHEHDGLHALVLLHVEVHLRVACILNCASASYVQSACRPAHTFQHVSSPVLVV